MTAEELPNGLWRVFFRPWLWGKVTYRDCLLLEVSYTLFGLQCHQTRGRWVDDGSEVDSEVVDLIAESKLRVAVVKLGERLKEKG